MGNWIRSAVLGKDRDNPCRGRGGGSVHATGAKQMTDAVASSCDVRGNIVVPLDTPFGDEGGGGSFIYANPYLLLLDPF